MTNLLPCPFCGDLPYLMDATHKGGVIMIGCNNPYCKVKPYFFSRDGDEAFIVWNTRKPTAAIAAAEEA